IVHGAEPLAIAESAPVAVKAFYVDEDKANEVLASAPLTNTGPNGRGQEIWSDEATPVAVEVKKTTPHIGVIGALSGKGGALDCSEGGRPCLPCEHNFVTCYDKSATGPLLHLAGYSLAGTGTLKVPLARKVTLTSEGANTCTDGYFSNSTATCTFTI